MTERSRQDAVADEITVVIPVFNEVDAIGSCLAQFQESPGVEVLVVDGGSVDDTAETVHCSVSGELIQSDRLGRSHQMNIGATKAKGNVLLFLHADCFLPQTWIADLNAALSDPTTLGGRFRHGILEDTLSFRLIAFFSTLRSRFLGITYGDQAIFVRKSVFEEIGGFPPRLIFEDSEFCDAVSRKGTFVMTDSTVVSSSRRWRAWGVWRTVVRMWILRILYKLSVSDDRLIRMYRNVR